MDKLQYARHEVVSLKEDPQFNETWLRHRMEEDPSILGLGNLELTDVERVQTKGGRLDLLLEDSTAGRRYEVELALGKVDESHIVRTIEYWNYERERYPQYDHCAIVVAEEITSRFLEFIKLQRNLGVQVIVIQVQALKVGDNVTLQFKTVTDETRHSFDERQKAARSTKALEPAPQSKATGSSPKQTKPVALPSRVDWERRGFGDSLAVLDKCFPILLEIDASIEVKYQKSNVVLTLGGHPTNFVRFTPRRQVLMVSGLAKDRIGWIERLEKAGIETIEGYKPTRTRFWLTLPKVESHRSIIKDFFETCYRQRR